MGRRGILTKRKGLGPLTQSLIATSTTWNTLWHFQSGNEAVFVINPTNGTEVWQDYAQTIPGVFGQPARVVDDESPSANNYETAPGHADATWSAGNEGQLLFGGNPSDTIGRTVNAVDFTGGGASTGFSVTFCCDVAAVASQGNDAGFYETLNPGVHLCRDANTVNISSFIASPGVALVSQKSWDGTPVWGQGLVCLTQRIGLTHASHDMLIATEGVDAAPMVFTGATSAQDPGRPAADILLFGIVASILNGAIGPIVIVVGRRIIDAEVRDLSRHLLALTTPSF